MKSVYPDSCHCCFKVENLRKVAEQASTAAAGTLTHPEGISMAEWGVLVSWKHGSILKAITIRSDSASWNVRQKNTQFLKE